MEAADDEGHANADEAAPLTVRKGGRSHRGVTHWFANTRFEASRLISWSAPPWGSDWFWNIHIWMCGWYLSWAMTNNCPPTGKANTVSYQTGAACTTLPPFYSKLGQKVFFFLNKVLYVGTSPSFPYWEPFLVFLQPVLAAPAGKMIEDSFFWRYSICLLCETKICPYSYTIHGAAPTGA